MRAVTAVALLASLAGARPVAAKTVAVAPLGALGVAPSEARAVEREIRAVTARMPGVRLVPREPLARLLRIARNYGCVERPKCIGPLGKKAGAVAVVTGDVGGIAGKYVVHLKLIDRRGELVRSVTGLLRAKKGGDRKALYATLVQLLSPERYTGALRIEVDVDGAWIYLDGRRVARGKKAMLRGIAVGAHALRITHEAYRDDVRFVRIAFARQSSVKARLRALPTHEEEMRLRLRDEPLTSAELPWYRRWWAVAAFGALILTATATTVALVPKSASPDRRVTLGAVP